VATLSAVNRVLLPCRWYSCAWPWSERPLGSLRFERLNGRLLIDREHDGVLGRREVEADDGGGFGGELGVARQAPGLVPGKVDPLGAQKAPDVLVADVAQRRREQRRGPTGEAHGRRPVEQRQDAPVGIFAVAPGLARARRVGKPGQPVPGEPHPPPADHAARTADLAGNRPARHAVSCQEHDPRSLDQTLFGRRRPHPRLERRPFLRRHDDRRRISKAHARPLAWICHLC
jgi:hypothetical protein